jgi:hypothetical protein
VFLKRSPLFIQKLAWHQDQLVSIWKSNQELECNLQVQIGLSDRDRSRHPGIQKCRVELGIHHCQFEIAIVVLCTTTKVLFFALHVTTVTFCDHFHRTQSASAHDFQLGVWVHNLQ